MNSIAVCPTRLNSHHSWKVALPAVIVALLLILAMYRETAWAMASIWWRSETYAHGFIVPPIALWLIWRKSSTLVGLVPRHNGLAMGLLGVAGLAWLLGTLAAVNVVPQFALVLMLVATVPAVLGWQVARQIAFPLLFLFFAVPAGDFVMPRLMEWTAQFTVFGLRLSGIPVYREGLLFVIPTGSWSVVEACSGVRYLIASLTVGTLFAYLTYHSLLKRLLFVGVSIIVPIIANWFRAYLTVLLGHVSNNKLAVGVDHLIYGWAFFGIVILAMFWVGARWREDERTPSETAVPASAVAASETVTTSSIAVAAVVIVTAAWPLIQWRIDEHRPPEVKALAPLGPTTNWQRSQENFEGWRPRFENTSASSQMAFQHDGRTAGLYIGYYRNQDQEHRLVSSTNKLVKSDDPVWMKTSSGTRDIAFDGHSLRVRTADLSTRGTTRLLVWHWYWINGRWTSGDIMAKVYTVLSRLSGGGDDSAVIVAYTWQSASDRGEDVLEEFIGTAGPAIDAALRQTAAQR